MFDAEPDPSKYVFEYKILNFLRRNIFVLMRPAIVSRTLTFA